jgi:hypothetical protein
MFMTNLYINFTRVAVITRGSSNVSLKLKVKKNPKMKASRVGLDVETRSKTPEELLLDWGKYGWHIM